MSDDKVIKPSFAGDTDLQEVWDALGELPRDVPSASLRRRFYSELERVSEETPASRIRRWLGFDSNAGWTTAAVCVLIGMGVGQLLNEAPSAEPERLLVLEQNVALLNRQLILDRLEDATAGKRLRGIVEAGLVVEDDAEIARALLLRATGDRVHSVRTAAIDALAPRLSATAVGDELMKLLESAESPLVQLALVDLVLRNGNAAQLSQLLQLAGNGALHPDLVRHVEKSLGRESV